MTTPPWLTIAYIVGVYGIAAPIVNGFGIVSIAQFLIQVARSFDGDPSGWIFVVVLAGMLIAAYKIIRQGMALQYARLQSGILEEGEKPPTTTAEQYARWIPVILVLGVGLITIVVWLYGETWEIIGMRLLGVAIDLVALIGGAWWYTKPLKQNIDNKI